jgi:hypothetical protein
MLVSEILEDATSHFGSCADAKFYRRLTDAVRALNNKGVVDLQLAEADFCVYDGLVTLPMEVDAVQAVTVDGQPTFTRSQWFQYSLSGAGYQKCTPCGYGDELGLVSTYRDPSIPVYLVAQTESVSDNSKKLRVYGWGANGKRIYTLDANGNPQDGFLVPTIYGFQSRNHDVPPIAKIDYVTKDETKGFIRLVAIDPADNTSVTQIGYYQPYETAPRYRRLRVSAKSWVRVKYRRKDLELRGPNDWINVDNREALLQMCKAVKFREANQYELARSAEAEAVRILNDAVEAGRPVTSDGITVIYTSQSNNDCEDRLFY